MTSAPDGKQRLQGELTNRRVLAAPRSLVFRMWTDPKHLPQWWGGHIA